MPKLKLRIKNASRMEIFEFEERGKKYFIKVVLIQGGRLLAIEGKTAEGRWLGFYEKREMSLEEAAWKHLNTVLQEAA
ncbi:MAG: hypothetical protein R6V40_02225 [Candidatus Moraniibacteriota bacterium]